MHGNVAAQCKVAVAPAPADTGDLDRALVDMHVIDLIRFGRRMGTRDRNVDRRIDRDADIDEAAREMAAAAIAGAALKP